MRGTAQKMCNETSGVRSLLQSGEREDSGDVIAGFAIRRDAVELLHCSWSGIVGSKREFERRSEPINQRLQVLDPSLDVGFRLKRVSDVVFADGGRHQLH